MTEKINMIKDNKLARCISKVLDKKENSLMITKKDLKKLKKLTATNSGIEDLTGLEHAKNLKELNLGENSIKD